MSSTTGSPRLPGPGREQWEVLLSWLDFIRSANPTKREMEAWIRRQHGGAESTASRCLLHVREIALVEWEGGTVRLTQAGEDIRTKQRRADLLAATLARCTGFQDLLDWPKDAFTTRDAAEYLRSRDCPWLDKQGSRPSNQVTNRLNWLVACGRLEHRAGRWYRTIKD